MPAAPGLLRGRDRGYWVEKIGADDIDLGGSTINATGVTTQIPKFGVGDFDDGDSKDYNPPKVLKEFDLRTGTEWPKSYFVVLVLVEVDMGGYAEFMDKLVNAIDDEVEKPIATAIGVGVGVASDGVVGAAIGLAVGYCVDLAIEWIKSVWKDDVFSPVTIEVELPGRSARFGGETQSQDVTVEIKGHDGKYRLTYDWNLTNFSNITVVSP